MVLNLSVLRDKLADWGPAPDRRLAVQRELADCLTPADRAELDTMLRGIPAAQTADIRDFLYR